MFGIIVVSVLVGVTGAAGAYLKWWATPHQQMRAQFLYDTVWSACSRPTPPADYVVEKVEVFISEISCTHHKEELETHIITHGQVRGPLRQICSEIFHIPYASAESILCLITYTYRDQRYKIGFDTTDSSDMVTFPPYSPGEVMDQNNWIDEAWLLGEDVSVPVLEYAGPRGDFYSRVTGCRMKWIRAELGSIADDPRAILFLLDSDGEQYKYDIHQEVWLTWTGDCTDPHHQN